MTTWGDLVQGDKIRVRDRIYTVVQPCPDSVVTDDLTGREFKSRVNPLKDVEKLPTPLIFDIETCDASELFKRSDFVRLCGYGDSTTTSTEELIQCLMEADEIVGHNIMGFDLLALCHHHGADWEKLSAKARDTLLLARLADPPRSKVGGSVTKYDLDSVADRLGVERKSDGLRALKKEFGGYDKISVDDHRYVDYLKQDLVVSRQVSEKLLMTRYGAREHKLASLAGRMTLNGFRVDVPLLRERIAEGEEQKRTALAELNESYGLPLSRIGRDRETRFSSPLSTTEGVEWWSSQVTRFGWRKAPRTPKGRLSTGAKDLSPVLDNPRAPEELKTIVRLMATVTQVRTVYQTVEDNLTAEGRVHSQISMGQSSGRWSVTKPGLTVFGKRGGRHVERDIFLPEEGHVLISCDLSQVDMRGVAGHCQDPAYMALFAPGQDVHTQIAVQIWGDPGRRQDAKAIGHGANYGLGAKRMIASGHDPEAVYAFFAGMEESFPRLFSWRNAIREKGSRGELLDNGFGRLMRCDPERAYTQAPALMGQGSARDLMCEALLRLPEYFRPFLRAMVHDEIVLSIPEDLIGSATVDLLDAFTYEWRGVPILCDASKPGKSWGDICDK